MDHPPTLPSRWEKEERKKKRGLLEKVMGGMKAVDLDLNPTACSVLEIIQPADGPICYDHLAFRTFGECGHGIDAIARLFLDYGCKQQDELNFPAKKLKALWFSRPNYELPDEWE